MTIKEITDKILSFTDDVVLSYSSEEIFINPWNESKFELGYKDLCKTYTSIEQLLNDKIFEGKSLTNIAPYVS